MKPIRNKVATTIMAFRLLFLNLSPNWVQALIRSTQPRRYDERSDIKAVQNEAQQMSCIRRLYTFCAIMRRPVAKLGQENHK